MATSIGIDNEQLGSAHFDAIREQDEARAFEDVRQKERELEQEAVHAFDDLLEHSASSDTSSYYKPPTSQYECNSQEEELNQCHKELERSRRENVRLATELSALRRDFEQLTKDKSAVEDQLQKVQTRVGLLEQENGELSDTQTVHRVKDQYELILEKLTASHKKEKAGIIQQLNKFKEEAQRARNHICVAQEVQDEKLQLESELKLLKVTVEKLRHRELELQLKVKEQSILLREQERSESPSVDWSDAVVKICHLAEISTDNIHDNPVKETYRSLLDACYVRLCTLRDNLTQNTLELEQTKKKCDELRVCAATLEKDNHLLKDKLEHNNSDTESQSDIARLGHLKAAQVARATAEHLESQNLQLKLQLQTLEEEKSAIQLELTNLRNVDAKHRADINELLNERQKLAVECCRAREVVAEARRAEEMAKELLESGKDLARKEADAAANARLQEEVKRMESQLAREKEIASEAIARQLRAECVRQLQERLAKMEREKEDELRRTLEIERRNAQGKTDELHERAVVLAEEVEELRKEHQAVCQEKNENAAKLRNVEADLDEAQYQLTHKDDQISRLKSQLEDMRLKDEAQIGEIAQMQKKITIFQNTMKKAKSLLTKAETEKQTAAASSQELQKENQALRAKLNTLSQNVTASQDRCKELETALAALSPRDQEMPGGSGDDVVKDTCSKLAAELEQCREQLADAEGVILALEEQLRSKISTMQRVRDQLIAIKDEGRKYDTERLFLVQTIDRLENEALARKRQEANLRSALEEVTDKVIEKLVERHRFVP
ncbi:hypothetical protein BIW11_02585 [Tropilaelaps mercedesae]|uniref:Uncharacterized protein n=1 Tax=Tropilaelaps mercedesae TaxID=418985 RepID=A0A1V9Y0I8_9ACAR|nr:hypothetical protein BIW11_02585 [Tropilaelaps mercedesae]